MLSFRKGRHTFPQQLRTVIEVAFALHQALYRFDEKLHVARIELAKVFAAAAELGARHTPMPAGATARAIVSQNGPAARHASPQPAGSSLTKAGDAPASIA